MHLLLAMLTAICLNRICQAGTNEASLRIRKLVLGISVCRQTSLLIERRNVPGAMIARSVTYDCAFAAGGSFCKIIVMMLCRLRMRLQQILMRHGCLLL